MITHTTEIRVRYQETDAMGIVYHGNYLTWFEIARIALLDELGLPYHGLEAQGYRLPVLEVNARYRQPARFDDRVRVEAKIAEMPKVRIRIEYALSRGEDALCSGHTLHAFMDPAGKPLKPPPAFLERLASEF